MSPSLTAHQKLPHRAPALQLFAHPDRGGHVILRWERLYSGAEPDSTHAAAIANDGSLIRARNDAGNLRVSRVTNPGPGSTYSSWSLLTAGLSTGSGVALAARSAELLLAYSTGTALLVRTSADNGASWSAPTTVVTEASNVTSIAVAFTGSDACLFYGIAGSATTLKRLRRTAGAWAGSGTNWTNTASVASITGIAATHDGGDFAIIVTGTAATTTHRRAWSCSMGDLLSPVNTWTALATIAEADAASGVTFAWPSISLYAGARLRATFRQAEAGSVAFTRAMETLLLSATSAWAEPFPHEASSSYGLALAPAATYVWAATPSGVWRAPIPANADLSPRVLSCTYRLTPHSARCTVELDNTDGALAAAPNPTVPALMTGGSIVVLPGYRSGAGGAIQYGVALRFTIDRLTYRLHDGRRTLRIDASGGWERAERFHMPQPWQAASGLALRSAIFIRLAARAALTNASTGASADWTAYQPGFAVAPGETLASAIRRLMSVVTDGIRTGTMAVDMLVTGRPTSPAPAGAFGAPGEHPITTIELVDEPPPANWLRLQGPDRYAEAVDLPSIAQHGPRIRPLRNLDASTNAKASAYADAARRRDQLEEPVAELVCPFHAGLELFDPIAVTAPGLGLATTTYRVLAAGLDYRRGPTGARYDSLITLGPA
ncbi:MAG: hypothetical protein IT303_13165 [Dehalococcoidia bacterium]|nr:hypothetical protein [Dehalococcoidia bacterium]